MRVIRRLGLGRGPQIVAKVKRLVAAAAKKHRLQKAFLFGSTARGDYSEASDVDLLLVGDFKERFLQRGMDIEAGSSLPLQLFCYTPQEFEKMRRERNPFAVEAEKGLKLLG